MRLDWNQPPGGVRPPRSFRQPARKILTSFLVGVISMGVAWAGAGLVPVNDLAPDAAEQLNGSSDAVTATGEETPGATGGSGFDAQSLASGQLLAGAVKYSIKPRPEDYNGTWQKENCRTLPSETPDEDNWQEYPKHLEETVLNNLHNETHVADFRVRWNEHSNCIYMGGYGLGPMFPITGWDDEYDLWARAVAMSDGNDTVVLTLLDAVYWEGRYNSMCDGCGFLDLSEQLAESYGYKPTGGGPNGDQPVPGANGITPASFVFASTHSHTSPDFIGGWGGVPPWYMQQVTDTLKAAATEAVKVMQPAVLETGEVIARQFNGERRDFYRSAEDDGLSWFRLIAANDLPKEEYCPPVEPAPEEPPNSGNGNGFGNAGKATPSPTPTPECEPADPGTAIATVGAYAAHPVTADESAAKGDADFPAVFAKRVEEAFGGTGMFLQTGLGNISPRGNKVEMGNGLAALIPAIGKGGVVTDPNVRVGRTGWDQPVTNVPLGSLGVAGFFDRKFNEAPAAVREGKGGEENKKCTSASPVSVDTTVSAAKIGSLWLTGAPGEIFSNFSNTIEERNPGGVTMALGLVNDGLGYIVQAFETDHVGRQGVGFAGKAGPIGLSEYEDAYSIDHCFGDAALENTIRLLNAL